MPTPTDRVYTQTHEWLKAEGSTVTIGITRHAVDQLTDVTYVSLRPVGTSVRAGDPIGEVESVKTTSDVYSACAGEIIDVNAALTDDPGALNRDPYAEGWLVRLRATDTSGLGGCLDAASYDAHAG